MSYLINPYLYAAAGDGSSFWEELDRTKLTGSSDTCTVANFDEMPYLMILSNALGSGDVTNRMRVGDGSINTSGVYANRSSYNGGADTTGVNETYLTDENAFGVYTQDFRVTFIDNTSSTMKSLQSEWTFQRAAGATNINERGTGFSNINITTGRLDNFQLYNDQSGDFIADTEVVVLGADPATPTTSVWEELANVTASGSSQNLSSGTIADKKYLWIELFQGGVSDCGLSFNNDNSTSYTRRFSSNGGSEDTEVSQTDVNNMIGAGTSGSFGSCFVCNVADQEKLMIGHQSRSRATGAGSNSVQNYFWVSKYANTSAAITEIDIDSGTGNFPSTSTLKVYGFS